MAYTPTLWAKGDVVTSEKLNKIEQGIVDKVDKVDGKGLSTNDYTDQDKAKLDGLESQIDHLESLVGSPLVASTAAEMIDEDKVYVYTGSETGYQSGNWYYYNGTTWTSGGVYNSVAFETDDTLSIQGKAADAKKTGDELLDLKEDLTTNLDLFNCFDLLREFATYQSEEKDGVTFTWNDDHTVCNADGSTTKTTCFNVLYRSADTLPSQLVAGETYIFRVNTTPSRNLRLYMYQYHSDSSLNGYSYITSDTILTLPSTLIGLVLRIQVKSNTSVSNDKISVFITKTKTNAELASDLSELSQPRGLLASDVALNDVTDEGVWLLDSGTDYTNSPLPHGKAGTLEVFKDGICIVQRLTRYDGESVYFRTSNTQGSFANRDWHEVQGGNTYNNTYTTQVYENDYNITCSPTITTDTNNFLASTGDSTDRTSAIQTMLNSTGICRLGSGDFYVTGVTIPDFGALVGSGNSTRLILDSSVTTGCAINLSNNCVVKDMRIVGQATGTYTGQSTVGTRHGILWTATADAQTPTRKRRCIIDNCQIWYFNGGAITCSNVGGNIDSNLLISNCFIYGCDAGINIAYYSEFHRVTNVSVTHCYYGCISNGGNCNFVNCSFSYNMVGILMDNGTGQSPNNSHGVFSACTVCHSGANNDGIAIKVLNCDNGEVFTGLQVHFGSIIVDDSKAIRFVGCQFGRNVPMTLTNNTLITFADCSVSDTSIPTVTQSGNTTIVFDRCYKYDGAVFNPVA